MCRFPRAVLLFLLASRALSRRESDEGAMQAERLEVDSAADQGYLKKSLKWCSLQAAKLQCDDESIIMVKTAFYNRQQANGCTSTPKDPSKVHTQCNPNALKDLLVDICDKKRSCDVPAEVHVNSCPDNPYTFIRVTYECIAGTPENADEAFLGDETILNSSNVTGSDAPEEARQQSKMPGNSAVGPRMKAKGATSSTSTTTMRIRGEAIVKTAVQKDLDVPDQEVSLQPCYRYTRMQRILELKFFSSLTNCHRNEGCYEVAFDDGRKFNDSKTEPEPEAFLSGHLVFTSYNYLIFWRGKGLKKNDYKTWGVCLPRTQGIEYAMYMFESLQERYAVERNSTFTVVAAKV